MNIIPSAILVARSALRSRLNEIIMSELAGLLILTTHLILTLFVPPRYVIYTARAFRDKGNVGQCTNHRQRCCFTNRAGNRADYPDQEDRHCSR